jgi:dienelactone hydrolase
LLEESVEIPVFHGCIGAKLFLPVAPKAAVIIALPSGIARLGRLELFGARALARAGFTTLLVDLFTEEEDDARTGGHADVPMLADRILTSARWLNSHGVSSRLQLGLVGVGAAATAALFASAMDVDRPFAVVSRGACATLASASLSLTRVPSLFIVDGGDARFHEAQREACGESAQRQIEIVAQVDGPGCDQVTALITGWFNRWLAPQPRSAWTGLSIAQ